MENKVIVKIVIAIVVVVSIAAAANMYLNRHNPGQSGLPVQDIGVTTKAVNDVPKSAPQQEPDRKIN